MTTRAMGWGVLVAVALTAMAGCGMDDSGPRPVTDAEADRVAEALFENYDAGGAEFTLTALMPTGTHVDMRGEVDFVSGVGRAWLVSTGPDAAIDQVAWVGDTMLEHIPGLPSLAAAVGQESTAWVARPADYGAYEVDALVAVVMALASQVRENPQLLQQRGVLWMRHDTVAGVDVDVFQYGSSTRFWIEQDGIRLWRFEGNNSVGTRPVLIDLTHHGVQTVELPIVAEITPIMDIGAIYDAARSGPSN